MSFALFLFVIASHAAKIESVCQNIKPLENFSIDAFKQQIQKQNIKSVEGSLCLVPQEIKNNYVMIHSSQSAQGGTPKNPRVIVYDPGPSDQPLKYAFSFNGSDNELNGKNIEIMELDMGKSLEEQIQFSEIKFKKSEHPEVSGKNPSLCLSCHSFNTSIPRPLWDAIGFFPSAIGGSGNLVATDKDINIAKAYKRFLKTADKNQRYSQLQSKSNISEMSSRNADLAIRLAIYNRRRLQQLLKDTPDFSKYKFALAGVAHGCENVSQFLPHDVVPNHQKHGVDTNLTKKTITDEDLRRARAAMAEMFDCPKSECDVNSLRDLKNMADNFKMSPEVFPYFVDTSVRASRWPLSPTTSTANFRWLIEGRGISMTAWSMDSTFHGGGFYRFNTRNGSLLDEAMRDVEKEDRELNQIAQSHPEKICQQLRDASLAAFKKKEAAAEKQSQGSP